MTLQEWERQHILTVLVKTDWNLNKAAHLLRISESGLEQKIKEHRLELPKELSNRQGCLEG
jgi:DNA-binding NtrC family response regulator